MWEPQVQSIGHQMKGTKLSRGQMSGRQMPGCQMPGRQSVRGRKFHILLGQQKWCEIQIHWIECCWS